LFQSEAGATLLLFKQWRTKENPAVLDPKLPIGVSPRNMPQPRH